MEQSKKWIEEDKEKGKIKIDRFSNFNQRQYTKEEIEDLERKLLRMR